MGGGAYRLSAGVELLLLVTLTFGLAELVSPRLQQWVGGDTPWANAVSASAVHAVNAALFILARVVVRRPAWRLREFGVDRTVDFRSEARDGLAIAALVLAFNALVFGVAMALWPSLVGEVQQQLRADSWGSLLPQVTLLAPVRNAFSEEVRYHAVGQGLFMDRCGPAWGLAAGLLWFGSGHGLVRSILLAPTTVLGAAYYGGARRIAPLFLAHWLNDVAGAVGLRLWSVGWTATLGYGAACVLLLWAVRRDIARVLETARAGLITACDHGTDLSDRWSMASLVGLLVGYHLLVRFLYA